MPNSSYSTYFSNLSHETKDNNQPNTSRPSISAAEDNNPAEVNSPAEGNPTNCALWLNIHSNQWNKPRIYLVGHETTTQDLPGPMHGPAVSTELEEEVDGTTHLTLITLVYPNHLNRPNQVNDSIGPLLTLGAGQVLSITITVNWANRLIGLIVIRAIGFFWPAVLSLQEESRF